MSEIPSPNNPIPPPPPGPGYYVQQSPPAGYHPPGYPVGYPAGYPVGYPVMKPVSYTAELVLAVIGGVIGLGVGLFAVGLGGVVKDDGVDISALGAAAIVVSIIGIAAGIILPRKPRAMGWLLIACAVGVVVAVSAFGVVPGVLFLIAGVMAVRKAPKGVAA